MRFSNRTAILQRLSCFSALMVAIPTSAAMAQVADTALMIPAEIDVRGRGWSQLQNIGEMLDFGLTFLETTILTALLAFHPVNSSQSRNSATIDMRKGLFLFAFIGMLTGFLVLHHGYLIGFVIFGIGGLFRFRMASSSISDTAQLVVVALIGLAAGLDLPVMALIASVAAWVVISVFGGSRAVALEVKFDEQNNPHLAMLRLKDELEKTGFAVNSMSQAKFKPTAQYQLETRERDFQSSLIRKMTELQDIKEIGIVGWYVE